MPRHTHIQMQTLSCTHTHKLQLHAFKSNIPPTMNPNHSSQPPYTDRDMQTITSNMTKSHFKISNSRVQYLQKTLKKSCINHDIHVSILHTYHTSAAQNTYDPWVVMYYRNSQCSDRRLLHLDKTEPTFSKRLLPQDEQRRKMFQIILLYKMNSTYSTNLQ